MASAVGDVVVPVLPPRGSRSLAVLAAVEDGHPEAGCSPVWNGAARGSLVSEPADRSWALTVLRDGQAVPGSPWVRVSPDLAYRP